MDQKSKAATLILSILILVALVAGGYWTLRETKPKVCPVCARDIDPHSSAVVLIDKKPVRVCCIRCGITHNVQAGTPGEIIEVTDFLSGKPLKPDAALYVEGSRISMCDPHGAHIVDQTKHPYGQTFDRCEPSTFAFSRPDDAESFARQNGGKLLTWEELKKEAGVQP